MDGYGLSMRCFVILPKLWHITLIRHDMHSKSVLSMYVGLKKKKKTCEASVGLPRHICTRFHLLFDGSCRALPCARFIAEATVRGPSEGPLLFRRPSWHALGSLFSLRSSYFLPCILSSPSRLGSLQLAYGGRLNRWATRSARK